MSGNNSELAATWTKRIRAQRESGMTQRAWCAAEGLSINTFQWWVKRLRPQAKEKSGVSKSVNTFVQIVPTSEESQKCKLPGTSPDSAELTVWRLKLPADYDLRMLHELLEDVIRR